MNASGKTVVARTVSLGRLYYPSDVGAVRSTERVSSGESQAMKAVPQPILCSSNVKCESIALDETDISPTVTQMMVATKHDGSDRWRALVCVIETERLWKKYRASFYKLGKKYWRVRPYARLYVPISLSAPYRPLPLMVLTSKYGNYRPILILKKVDMSRIGELWEEALAGAPDYIKQAPYPVIHTLPR